MMSGVIGCIGVMPEEQMDKLRAEVCKTKLNELARQLMQGDTPQEIRNNLEEAKVMLNNIDCMFDFVLGLTDDKLTDNETIFNGIMEIFKEGLANNA